MKPFDKIIAVRSIQGLTSSQKILLLIIASHLGNNSRCFLSYETLREETCIQSDATISKNLQVLKNLEFIYIISPDSGFKSNRYEVNFKLVMKNIVDFQKENTAHKILKRKARNEKLKSVRECIKLEQKSYPHALQPLKSKTEKYALQPLKICTTATEDMHYSSCRYALQPLKTKRNIKKIKRNLKESTSCNLKSEIEDQKQAMQQALAEIEQRKLSKKTNGINH